MNHPLPEISTESAEATLPSKRALFAQIVAFVVALAFTAGVEIVRYRDLPVEERGTIGWLFGERLDDTMLYLLLLEMTLSFPVLVAMPLRTNIKVT